MSKYKVIALISLLILPACAKNNASEWENVDYAKIAKENYRRENDVAYTAPTVNGCVDDDLYNCSGRNAYH